MRKLYNHFQQLHSTPNANLLKKQEEIIKELEHKKTTLLQLNNLDKPFSEKEVIQSIKMLKNKKAAGLDRIRNEMLKSGAHYLTTSLTKLFNFILSKGTYPDSRSTGLITPIFKSGNKSDPSNYRGICVTSCLGKLFSVILNNRLLTYLQDHNLIHPSQIGFLKGFRTSDHIFSLRTVEGQHTQFYKCFLGLNRRVPNVVARNETGRLPLKLNILLRIIKFWIHLESLPENSIAKQCLIISNQLANETKPSFMLTVHEFIHNYLDIQKQSHRKTIQNNNNIPTIKHNLQK